MLDRLHEELVATVRKFGADQQQQQQQGHGNEDEGWEEVGPRNQTARVQETAFTQSPVTAIFGGSIRSTVSTRGTKSASVTTQPFYSLQLDIQVHPCRCGLVQVWWGMRLQGSLSPPASGSAQCGRRLGASDHL